MAINLARIHPDSEGRIQRCESPEIRPCPFRPEKGGEVSIVIPQFGGADGDALLIIEGAGGDAFEIGLNRIETIINLRCAGPGKGLEASLGLGEDAVHGGECLGSHTLSRLKESAMRVAQN